MFVLISPPFFLDVLRQKLTKSKTRENVSKRARARMTLSRFKKQRMDPPKRPIVKYYTDSRVKVNKRLCQVIYFQCYNDLLTFDELYKILVVLGIHIQYILVLFSLLLLLKNSKVVERSEAPFAKIFVE